MSEASSKILELIENVDVDDTNVVDMLNEIDCHVYAYLKLHDNFDVHVHKGGKSITYRHNSWEKETPSVLMHLFKDFQYTKSRDLLKSIRPEGWSWYASSNVNMDSFVIHTGFVEATEGQPLMHDVEFLGEVVGKTEELAELHAIIQAIAYERAIDSPSA